MLAPNSGNMAKVYADFWRMHEIAGEVEAAINYVVSRAADTEAEISGDEPAYWFLVETFAGDDVKAMRWLARRRFGVFRPMKQRVDKRNDTKLQGFEAAFPGWLFVYTWNIDRMLRRILSLPGVMRVLSDPVSQSPVPIPAWFVEDLRTESFKYKDNAPHAQYGRLYHEAERQVIRHKKRRKRPGKRIKAKVKRGLSTPALTESGIGATQPRPAVAG